MNFRTKNAAQYVGSSQAWLRKQRRLGMGPAYIRIGGMIIYRKADLDLFLERHLCQPKDVIPTSKPAEPVEVG